MLSPNEQQLYVFAMSFVAAIFVAAIVRLWLLRREEERLLKNKEALEKQIVIQQKDLLTVRQESNAWRIEMQRQFDLFRHMASDQLSVEEKRFNELLSRSQKREFELQTSLDIAKQMCSELPAAQARILYLESLSTPATTTAKAAAKPDSDEDGGLPSRALPVTPMPDLGGGGESKPAPVPPPSPVFEPAPPLAFIAPPPPPLAPAPPPPPPVIPPVEDEKLGELEQKLAEAEKKNAHLQQVLTTMRLRSRAKSGSRRKGTRRLERV